MKSTPSISNTIEEQRYLVYNQIILFIAYVATLLTTSDGSLKTVGSGIVLLCMIALFKKDEFYFLLPLFIFFYAFLVLPGIVLFRFYTLLLFVKMLLDGKYTINKKYTIILIIFSLYSLFVISFRDLRQAFSILFDIYVVILYISNVLDKENNFYKFFEFFVIGALVSGVIGLFGMNSFTNMTYQMDMYDISNVARYNFSFNDPNYAGFFFNIAIFAILSLNLFKNKLIKISIIIILYIMIVATVSTTAVIFNVIGLFVFMVFYKSKRAFILKALFISIVCFILVFASSGLITDTLKSYKSTERFALKIEQFVKGDYDNATTERTAIWRRHLEYYFGQPMSNILLGGNYLTDYGRDEKFRTVSHQAFIDMLIDFGIIGTMYLIIFFLKKSIINAIELTKAFNERSLLLIIISCIWAFYAFGLSMFPSWSFMIFFLI